MPTRSEYQVKCANDKQKHADDNYGGNDEIRNAALHDIGHDGIDEKDLEPLTSLTALKGEG